MTNVVCLERCDMCGCLRPGEREPECLWFCHECEQEIMEEGCLDAS